MASYVQSALFLYDPDTENLIKQVVDNPLGCQITPVALQEFLDNPEQHLQRCNKDILSHLRARDIQLLYLTVDAKDIIEIARAAQKMD